MTAIRGAFIYSILYSYQWEDQLGAFDTLAAINRILDKAFDLRHLARVHSLCKLIIGFLSFPKISHMKILMMIRRKSLA